MINYENAYKGILIKVIMASICDKVKGLSHKECVFLRELNRKMRWEERCKSGFYKGRYRFNYHNGRRLTSKELKRTLQLTEKSENLFFYPINTNHGFDVGFEISVLLTGHQTGRRPYDEVLGFLEDQLPREYDFQKLAKYFMKPENLRRTKEAKVEIQNDRKNYTY